VRASGVTRFEMGSRAMSGWVHVSPVVVATDDELRRWVGIGATYAGSLPAKVPRS
jgi:hypothetical protein